MRIYGLVTSDKFTTQKRYYLTPLREKVGSIGDPLMPGGLDEWKLFTWQ